MKVDFGCSIGDILYFVDRERKKVRRFTVDCLKVFQDNITAHGKLEWASFTIPYECSLKYLNKKFIFTKKKDAVKWMESKLMNQEENYHL